MHQPGAFDDVMAGALGKVLVTRMRARRVEASCATRGPAAHHRVGHVGMKLKAEGMSEANGLHREVAPFGEQLAAHGKLKSLTVPVIDLIGPVRGNLESSLRGTDRIIAHLDAAAGMRRHAGTEVHREHLRAEADTEKRPLLQKR